MNNTMSRAETGSIQKLDKNRWRVRVSGGYDPVTGKRIRKSKTVHGTKKDAIAERTRMQIEVGDMSSATKDMTLGTYIQDVFLPWERNRVRETTFYRVNRVLMTNVVPSLGHIRLDKLSAYTVETWLDGFERQSVRRTAFTVLRQAVTQAYKWDMVAKNVFDKLDKPRYDVPPKTVADGELSAMILGALYGERIEAPILLQLSCGMRLSEAMAIDWEDIDWKTGKVRIWRNYQVVVGSKEGKFFEPKTRNSNRTVTIPAGALSRLHEIRTEGGAIRKGPLAVGDDGNRMKPDSLRYRYRKLWGEKLPDQPFIMLKNLRHSHATILLEQGVDLKTISDRLGHANINITTSNYIQHVERLDEGAAGAFDLAVNVAGVATDDAAEVLDFPQPKEA